MAKKVSYTTMAITYGILSNVFLTHQRHRVKLLELDVADSLEAPRLVAHDQLHVFDLAHRGEELLHVP